MWTETKVFAEDLERICRCATFDWRRFAGRRILITGGTGLIGQTLASALVWADLQLDLGLEVLLLVRDMERAERLFDAQLREGRCIRLVEGCIEQLPDIPGAVDYIVHGASMTSSQAFVHQPVEVIRTAVRGTENILEFARAKGIEKMVYLSSMEIYGYPAKGHKVREDEAGALPPTVIRNGYPLSKQLCENLCCAYASEYGVPVSIARLTQTFGPGVRYGDTRVFAEFARAAIEHRDIVLKTKGETERCYLYTMDAASAILTLLLDGAPGEAYNAANEATYCTIAEMAEAVASLGNVHCRFELQDVTRLGYANTLYMDLDTAKLRALGWSATKKLKEMYEGLISAMAKTTADH